MHKTLKFYLCMPIGLYNKGDVMKEVAKRLKAIKIIQTRIDSARKESQDEISSLKGLAYDRFNNLMELEPYQDEIKKLVSAVEQSKELTQIDDDEFYAQWVRADFRTLIDYGDAFQRELLADYLQQEHYITVDYKNDVAMYSIGPAILINEDGDVLDQDSGKWIISVRDYKNNKELYSKIEAWMESKGYFPSVIKCDMYRNLSYVDTQSNKQKAKNRELVKSQKVMESK